jgi:NADPH:quinone reductase-like Zn-dependent oxidoreductase
MRMKAVVYEKYGPPEVLQLKDVDKPVPNNDEVLIKIFAASVNVEDLDYLKGDSWAVRMLGPLKPKYHTLGFDVAGRVEAIGTAVTQFKPGDEVMGDLFNFGFGAFAEYVCAPGKALVKKPVNITFEQAATLPSRTILALQGLRGKRSVKPGQTVLINGAGGGVGPFAVQLARYFGAEVTAVDSPKKLDMLLSIGADYVIDYTKEDFTKNGKRYDLILDIAAHHSIFDYRRALCSKGIYSLIGGSRSTIFQIVFLGPLISLIGNKKMGLVAWKPNKKEDLDYIIELVELGKIKPVIDRCYFLDEIDDAFRYFEEGNPRGKIVITMESNNKKRKMGEV